MNKFTQMELEKVKHLLPEGWTPQITHIVVGDVAHPIRVGNRFVIQIEDYVIDQPDSFSLSQNWNANTVPPETQLYITLLEIKPGMIRVDAVGRTNEQKWQGWIPTNAIKNAYQLL